MCFTIVVPSQYCIALCYEMLDNYHLNYLTFILCRCLVPTSHRPVLGPRVEFVSEIDCYVINQGFFNARTDGSFLIEYYTTDSGYKCCRNGGGGDYY
jgi:hypothetical protein